MRQRIILGFWIAFAVGAVTALFWACCAVKVWACQQLHPGASALACLLSK